VSADAPGAGDALLVRHAETEWARDGRHTGRTDIPLTDRGRSQAAALATTLGSWRFAAVLVSPATRARETCELAGLSDRARLEDDLQEWDYGDFEGLTTPQILAARPGWNLWRDGCPGGEQAADVGTRADRVIAALRGGEGAVAVFSHGHMLRVLGARWIGLGPQQGEHLGLSTGALCLLGHEHDAPILGRWNHSGSW
jgi:probable phosphoglycerate mutase